MIKYAGIEFKNPFIVASSGAMDDQLKFMEPR